MEAVSDEQAYEPGAEARIRFHVTDQRGEGVQAALKLQVVDEAVFALAEKQPGFAKVFFYLEQELMKPRFEIHSLSLGDAVEQSNADKGAEQDHAAQALFAAMEMKTPNDVNQEFGRELPQDKANEYTERYRDAFREQVRELAVMLSETGVPEQQGDVVPAIFAQLAKKQPSKVQDAWETPLRLEPTGWAQGSEVYYRVRNAGPDRQFGTRDDLDVTIEARAGTVVGGAGRSSLDVKILHDMGPMNGLGAMMGTVFDATGAVIPGTKITLRPISGT